MRTHMGQVIRLVFTLDFSVQLNRSEENNTLSTMFKVSCKNKDNLVKLKLIRTWNRFSHCVKWSKGWTFLASGEFADRLQIQYCCTHTTLVGQTECMK